MPKIRYVNMDFRKETRAAINTANEIIAEYQLQGYDLTLRQLYYQFVARDLLPNTPQNYKKLGSIINDGRLAGLIDWERIEDRTRSLEQLSTWSSPASIVAACGSQYKEDLWSDQDYRVEVWIEKEALAGVFERVCNELRIPYLSCRGYTSQSEMWRAGQRLVGYLQDGKIPKILHFGDHDPSGIDMSRDIVTRLLLFVGDEGEFEFTRCALTMDQVDEYDPPPNPAKLTDTRSDSYISKYGDQSWELDALDPAVLSNMVRSQVNRIRNETVWAESLEKEQEGQVQLAKAAAQWNKIVAQLKK